MDIITETKQKRINLANKIKAEFNSLYALNGAQKTPIYKELALRYNLSERTIINYLQK